MVLGTLQFLHSSEYFFIPVCIMLTECITTCLMMVCLVSYFIMVGINKILNVQILTCISMLNICYGFCTGVTIGLEISETSILESGGSVDAIVKVLRGSISNGVTVGLSTVERSAKGEVV